MVSPSNESTGRDPISFMASKSVAANLIMLILIAGGLIIGSRLKQEVFPEVDIDKIQIMIPYPGASPDDIEKGILIPVEERVRGLDGVKKVQSEATEGLAKITIDLMLDFDDNKVFQDVQNAVSSIRSLPKDAERPIIKLLTNQTAVFYLVLYGEQNRLVLRQLAGQLREGLLQQPGITLVNFSGNQDLELEIAVPQAVLRSHAMTLQELATAIKNNAQDLPAGSIKSDNGEIVLRTQERREIAKQFDDINIFPTVKNTNLRLGDIASINEVLADTDTVTEFNGNPSVTLEIYRTGKQSPPTIVTTIMNYVEQFRPQLPEGVKIVKLNDFSEIYKGRRDLLIRNACLGLVLVLLILGLFLEIRLAFWVMAGILTSFIGAFILLPFYDDVSINVISLFAFIITLGIVVDDAIIIGESIYERRHHESSSLQAAIVGTKLVATPVIFSVLTNIIAFLPMFFISGVMGKFFKQIPAIVVSIFLISLFESLFILPAHLAHRKSNNPEDQSIGGFLYRQQQKISRLLEHFVHTVYTPVLRVCLRNRYVSLAVGIALFIINIGLIKGEYIKTILYPDVDSEIIHARTILPEDSPKSEAHQIKERLVHSLKSAIATLGVKPTIIEGISSQIGGVSNSNESRADNKRRLGSHEILVTVYLTPGHERPVSAKTISNEWRKQFGEVAGIDHADFKADVQGPGGGTALDIELAHQNPKQLEQAAKELAHALERYRSEGIRDIDDGVETGKRQLDFKLRHESETLGLTADEVNRQIRNAFYGAEAFRFQHGRNEIKVMLRLPKEERNAIHDLEKLMIRVPNGGEIPLTQAVTVEDGYSYTSIKHVDRQRVLNVKADVVPQSNAGQISDNLEKEVLPKLIAGYPGLKYSFGGQQQEFIDSLVDLRNGIALALIIIFSLLAILFNSYIQPLIVMSAIPFGFIGAVLGHILMGHELSFVSMFGIIALSGVVINDSLVLIDYANRQRQNGSNAFDAIFQAGKRRFRPIFLTSITTFAGLAPMIFETSFQAQFLVPMAISLGYGLLFITVIVPLLIPALYLIVEDLKRRIA